MSDSTPSDYSENPEQEPTVGNVNPQSVEGLFLVALEKNTPEERAQFLNETCGDDIEQRRRVEALLMAYDDAGSFLEKSPVTFSDAAEISLDFLTPSDNPDLLGTLDEYDVIEKIGQGGMGIVFRALDPKLNRIVAIKVMMPLLAANPNARKRFLREAQAAAAISHPHIVTIHAVDEVAIPYLVMECVVGQSLQEKLDKSGSIPVKEILRIGKQIAEGLAAAHKQGLIHRDIKPANILLENGVERVKITDFGLARAVDDMTITRTGEVSGTPQYMSPEQATGERVDQRSDLFSLGAVLYAMCTGRSPFRASNLAAVVRRVCDDVPRPIEEINTDIPAWLIEIISQLLKKEPTHRIQTAEEVAELLGGELANIQQPGFQREDKVRQYPQHSEVSNTEVSIKRAFWYIAHAIMFLVGLVSFLDINVDIVLSVSLYVAISMGVLMALVLLITVQMGAKPFLNMRISDALSVPFALFGGTVLAQILSHLGILPHKLVMQGIAPFLLMIFCIILIMYQKMNKRTTNEKALFMDEQRNTLAREHQHNRGTGRFAMWMGGLLLLVPFVLWLIGTSGGGHSATNVTELVGIASIACLPIGFLILIYGAQQSVTPGTTAANIVDGLFLLACIFLGPIGLLIFISHQFKKREAHPVDGEQRPPTSLADKFDERIAQERSKSNKRILFGVGSIGGMLMIFLLTNGEFSSTSPFSSKDLVGLALLICTATGVVFLGVKYLTDFSIKRAFDTWWKRLGWGALAFCCLFVVMLIVPIIARRSNCNVLIYHHSKIPIVKIKAEDGILKEFSFLDAEPTEQVATISMKPGYREITIHYKYNNRIFTLKRKIVVPNKPAVRFEYEEILQHAADKALRLEEQTLSKQKKIDKEKAMANQGTILVDIQDPDLHAKISPLGKGRSKEPVIIFHHRPKEELESQKYLPGKCRVEVHDLVFGWSCKRKYYDQFEVEVEAGKTKMITIKRDYKKHAENHPDWSTQTSHNFNWSKSPFKQRQEFTLSTSQAKVVHHLLEGLAANKPDVKEANLLKILNESIEKEQHKTLFALFNNGKHPAWGTMIVAGKTKGTWRLQKPRSATVISLIRNY